MHWSVWVIAFVAFFVAIWFVIDGATAFVTGDYITPKSGEYAGQLGPWSKVVSAIGIAPRSGLMKTIFLLYGIFWLAIIVSYLFRLPWAHAAMLVAAIGSLWYLPFGTLLGLIQIVLLIVYRMK